MQYQLKELSQQARRLNFRRGIGLALLLLASFAGGILLMAAWDAVLRPLQESSAFLAVLLWLVVIALLSVIAKSWYTRRHHLGLRRMAARIESTYPEFNDRLTTAAHLVRTLDRDANPLETQVLSEAREGMTKVPWQTTCTRWFERPWPILAAALATLLLLLAAFFSNPLLKAGFHLRDQVAGQSSGLQVQPETAEVPRGTDYRFTVNVDRWQMEASVSLRSEEGIRREAIVLDQDGRGAFTLYGLDRDTEFRVQTPSLRSPWLTASVYDPPELDKVELRIEPPEYTRLPERTESGWVDREVVEGSRLTFSATAPAAEAGRFLLDEESISMDQSGPGQFSFSRTFRLSHSMRLLFRDDAERQYRTPEARLTVIPDQPPVVEILLPEEDASAVPDGVLDLELFAADDYGLATARLHFRVSGEPAGSVDLEPADEPLEFTFSEPYLLEDLELEDGDILSLYLEATDNRQPTANRSRTDLRFVEIRVPKPPSEMKGMPAERKEIDIRSLITEQKRLLRETHRALSLAGNEQEERLTDTASALHDLVDATGETLAEIEEDLAAAGGENLIQLFELAMQEDSRAADLLDQWKAQDSLQPQGVALSALLRVENALRQNIQSESDEEGQSGQGSSGESDSEKESQQSEDGEELQKLAKDLQKLIAKQNERNAAYQRAGETGWSSERARNEASQQRELRQRSEELRQQLQGIADSGDARAALSEASGQMRRAASRAASESAGGALRSGLRARESLRKAQGALSELAAEASSRSLRAAAQAAAQLAENQAEAARQSRQADAGDPDAPSLADQEAQQRALNEAREELLQRLTEQARQSASEDAAMSQALQDAATKGRQSGAGRQMQRAANALLYGQAGSASRQQGEAAQSLQEWSEQIQQSARELAADPARQAARMARQLGQTLEELAAYARDPDLMPESRLPEIREDWSRKLNQLQELTGQQQFGQMAQGLGGPLQQEWEGSLSDTRAVLGQAARALQQLLDEAAADSSLQLNRDASPPPAEYRKQVESYFRNLAREPDS